MTFNKGNKVTVLDDSIDGIVVAVNGDDITIETTDGFDLTYQANELILMRNDMNFASSVNMQQVLKEKEIPAARSFVKEKKTREIPAPEYDLHIEKLTKNFRGMSNYDILTLQGDTAKRHIEHAIKNRIPRIVFIHGVGEGILKAELDFLLGRYDNVDFRDANYQKYGLGATEVFIRQR